MSEDSGFAMMARALETMQQQAQQQQQRFEQQQREQQERFELQQAEQRRLHAEQLEFWRTSQRDERQERYTEERRHQRAQAASLPVFKGVGKEPVSNFITLMNQHFKTYAVPDDQRVPMAEVQLRGIAQEQWRQYRLSSHPEGDEETAEPTWETFQKFLRHFFPESEAQQQWFNHWNVQTRPKGGTPGLSATMLHMRNTAPPWDVLGKLWMVSLWIMWMTHNERIWLDNGSNGKQRGLDEVRWRMEIYPGDCRTRAN